MKAHAMIVLYWFCAFGPTIFLRCHNHVYKDIPNLFFRTSSEAPVSFDVDSFTDALDRILGELV